MLATCIYLDLDNFWIRNKVILNTSLERKNFNAPPPPKLSTAQNPHKIFKDCNDASALFLL